MNKKLLSKEIIDAYNEHPKYCEFCGKPILSDGTKHLNYLRRNKYCSIFCFNNVQKGNAPICDITLINELNKNVYDADEHSIATLVDHLSDEEILHIYDNSNSILEFSRSLGYKHSLTQRDKTVMKRLKSIGVDFDVLKDRYNNMMEQLHPKCTCKVCGKVISKQNKSGMCADCYAASRKNTVIKRWKETGDTGCQIGTNLRNAIREYIYQKQDYSCAICGMKNVWQNKEIKFILDHIDGNAANNNEENLRLICPNCDSQLDTYKSKNKNSARNFRHKYI